jgi:large subunit ribosomal protein L53
VSANERTTTEDGNVMDFDLEKLKIPGVLEEVQRHSRQLARKEELTAS